PGAFERTACGIAMTATAKLLSDLGDINVAFRSQARAINSRFTLFEHRDGFDFTDRQRIINKSVCIFVGSVGLLLHLEGLAHARDASGFISARGREDRTHELNPAPRVTCKHRFSSLRRFNPRSHELRSDFERAL